MRALLAFGVERAPCSRIPRTDVLRVGRLGVVAMHIRASRSRGLLAALIACALALGAAATPRMLQTPEPLPAAFPLALFGTDDCAVRALSSPLLRVTGMSMPGGKTVSLTRSDKATTADVWHKVSGSYSTSFFITRVAARVGGEQLYVAGMNSDGSCLIETWTFRVPDGRVVARYPGAPPTIGLAQGAFVPTLSVAGGGSWTPPPSTLADPHRSLLYSGPGGPYSALAVDPEGRFLCAYDWNAKAIVRFVFAVSPIAPEVLCSVAQFPALDKIGSLELRDFGAQGRILLTRRHADHEFEQATQVYGLLADPENDGNFAAPQFFTDAEFKLTPYANWSAWKQLFVVP